MPTVVTYPFPGLVINPGEGYVTDPLRCTVVKGTLDVSAEVSFRVTAEDFPGVRVIGVQLIISQVIPLAPCSGWPLGPALPTVVGTEQSQAPVVSLAHADLPAASATTRWVGCVPPGNYDITLAVFDAEGNVSPVPVTLGGVVNIVAN